MPDSVNSEQSEVRNSYREKSIIRIFFMRYQNLQPELDTICKEYRRVVEKQKKAVTKSELIAVERKRRKLLARIYILNLRLGGIIVD